MKWTDFIVTAAIVLIFVPMVFMGASVFFGHENFYETYKFDCRYGETPEEIAEYETCQVRMEQARAEFDLKYKERESYKYLFIITFSLAAIIVAAFTSLQVSLTFGLFLGGVIATFFATLEYMDSGSKLGFCVLVVVFAAAIYFVQKSAKRLLI